MQTIIILQDIVCLLFSLGTLIYSVKLYEILKDKGINVLIMATLYASLVRAIIVLKDFNLIPVPRDISIALMSVFWVLLFMAVYGLYKKTKDVVR